MVELAKINQIDIGSLKNQEWYQRLIDDCKTIITERKFNACWEVIQCKWEIGDRILQDEDKGITKLLQRVGVEIGWKKTELWNCLAFRRKYPDLNSLPEGKAISWHKIANKYLPNREQNENEPIVVTGQYRTIIIDPPWPMQKINREIIPYDEYLDYSTMTIEEIKNIGLPFAEDGCHVYLWTTHHFLPDAFEVFKDWGVKYECLLTWDKDKGMTPFSWMYSSEFVLFGRVGMLELLKKGEKVVFHGKRREHSRKPDEFYDLVRKVSPFPRIDIFGREKREGFEAWGDEINKFNLK